MEHLREITGLGLARAENLVEATQNTDVFVEVSGILKALASNLLKVATDLRLLASGPDAGLGEIRLPQRQAGSSIMPGKVNPVIPEAVSQVAMVVMGNDAVITQACSSGSLELNAFLPLIADKLLESLTCCSARAPSFADCASRDRGRSRDLPPARGSSHRHGRRRWSSRSATRPARKSPKPPTPKAATIREIVVERGLDDGRAVRSPSRPGQRDAAGLTKRGKTPMRSTPKGHRLHIGLFGRRNVGKSSLLNAMTRQHVSIVSDVAGTTTDPVEKPMELLPIGPVLFIDTAGIDDVGALGEMRVQTDAAGLRSHRRGRDRRRQASNGERSRKAFSERAAEPRDPRHRRLQQVRPSTHPRTSVVAELHDAEDPCRSRPWRRRAAACWNFARP